MLASIILIAAFAAWTYFASCFLPDSVYNLHVNRLRSALFRPVTGLQRTFPRLSERGAALALFCIVAAVCCLAVFLGGAAPQGAPHPGPGMSFGGGIAFLPMRAGSLPAAAFFVLGRFAILAGQLALVRAFVVWRHAGAPSDACEFFGVATWPLSSSRGWRVWNGGPGGAVVAKACAAIVAGTMLCVCASAGVAAGGGAGAAAILRLAALAVVDTLLVANAILFAGCIFSWLPLLPPAGAGTSPWRLALEFVAGLSSDSMRDMVRATVGNAQLSVAFVSFAPLLVFFAIRIAHPFLARLVAAV